MRPVSLQQERSIRRCRRIQEERCRKEEKKKRRKQENKKTRIKQKQIKTKL
jgi:hypothetical protein